MAEIRRVPIVGRAGLGDGAYLKPHAERGVRPPPPPTAADLDVPLTRLRKWEGTAPKTARAHITTVAGDGTLCGHDLARVPVMLRIESWAERADRRLCKVCAREWHIDRALGGRRHNPPPPVGELALAYPDPESTPATLAGDVADLGAIARRRACSRCGDPSHRNTLKNPCTRPSKCERGQCSSATCRHRREVRRG